MEALTLAAFIISAFGAFAVGVYVGLSINVRRSGAEQSEL